MNDGKHGAMQTSRRETRASAETSYQRRAPAHERTSARLRADYSPAAAGIPGQFPPILFGTWVWTWCGTRADVAKRTAPKRSLPETALLSPADHS